MVKYSAKKLSRKRFFEVKQAMEDYNKDLMSLAEFRKIIHPEEAEAYEKMFKEAGFELTNISFLN